MSFGSGYKVTEYNQFVPEGDYTVRLGVPREASRGGYLMLDVPIQIQGHPNYGPDKWTFFDRPTDDQEKIENWDKRMTRFFDAFKIPRGNLNTNTWAGKIGKVHVGKDKAGYMQVQYAVIDSAGPEAPASAPAKPAPAKPAPVQNSDGFPDDVPF